MNTYNMNYETDNTPSLSITHSDLVKGLIKNPYDISREMTPFKAGLIHDALGISGEAGELLDTIKKFSIYNKKLDKENIIEELGDLEFFMEDLRQHLNITREETLEHNINKLSKRYPRGYSDSHAQLRLDKVE